MLCLPFLGGKKIDKSYRNLTKIPQNVYILRMVKPPKFLPCRKQKYCTFTNSFRKQAIVMQFTIVT